MRDGFSDGIGKGRAVLFDKLHCVLPDCHRIAQNHCPGDRLTVVFGGFRLINCAPQDISGELGGEHSLVKVRQPQLVGVLKLAVEKAVL